MRSPYSSHNFLPWHIQLILSLVWPGGWVEIRDELKLQQTIAITYAVNSPLGRHHLGALLNVRFLRLMSTKKIKMTEEQQEPTLQSLFWKMFVFWEIGYSIYWLCADVWFDLSPSFVILAAKEILFLFY